MARRGAKRGTTRGTKGGAAKAAKKTRRFRPARTLAKVLVVAFALPIAATALYRVVPPPPTPLMAIRWIAGEGAEHRWVPLEAIADSVTAMVLAAEDSRFCAHGGYDWTEIANAVESWRGGGRLRGASTITMQVTRNLFLWPGGGWPRKGLEAAWTPFVELLLGKRRIMEIYLNVAETGPGLFGVEAAARRYFGTGADALSPAQAARIAAILPNPRAWSATAPGGYVRERAAVIARRAGGVARDCLASR